MAKQAPEYETTKAADAIGGNINNIYNKHFTKAEAGPEQPNGFGIKKVSGLAPFENVAGVHGSERAMLLQREADRFNDLSAKAFGRNIPITNEGIVLDAFGGKVGEGMGYPNLGSDEQASSNLGRRV